MNASKLIAAESSVALAGVIVSDILRQKDRTLPRPRRLLAVFLLYGVLSLVAEFGTGPARIAAAAGGVIALAGLVLGTGGAAVVALLQRGAGLIAPTQRDASGEPAAAAYYPALPTEAYYA